MNRFWPEDRAVHRLVRCVVGLAIFGLGVAMLIDADLGAAPWDVFHTGVSDLTGMPVGTVIILVGVALLGLWIPLRERVGLGTILNAVLIGATVDVARPAIPDDLPLLVRVGLMVGGVVVIAIGSGLYIGAGLGPGPRDGLMTGLGRRGISIRAARTGLELSVLLIGVLLGGAIGVGTAVFALGIGPLVHVTVPRLSIEGPRSADLAAAAAPSARPAQPSQ
ncbi:YczE/YyaS/YitT family protein [Desertimonas flava]|uniref:membrane protein YczE n=1 Tax=Desertimonas flava TaxID=2064846 RepID=UPI001968C9C3|nr:hypothetical protein [Desertimonas flava]